MRKLILGILLLAFGIGVFLITRSIYSSASQEVVHSDVLMQQMRKVLKLVTVEGDFSEIYDHKDSWHWKSSIPGLTEKKALLRIKARVQVGYDLSNINIEADEATHSLYLGPFPEATVLSIEHDVDYYDISESTFNHFNEQELNAINRKAKERILEKVAGSGLYQAAAEQKSDLIQMVTTLAEKQGWTVVEGPRPVDGRSRLKG